MVISLWDFPANITLSPIPGLTSIVAPSRHRIPPSRLYFFPQRFFFSMHAPTSRTSIPPHIIQQVLSIYVIRMLPQHSKLTCIHGYSITKFIPHNQDRNDGNPCTFSARFLHTSWQPLQIRIMIRAFPVFIILYQAFSSKILFWNTRVTMHICQPNSLIQYTAIMNTIIIHSTPAIHFS